MNEHHFYQDTPGEYHTGLNPPPKKGGLLAFALVTTIFLCGVVSLLSLANISLLELKDQPEKSNISLAKSQDHPSVCFDLRTSSPIQGQSLSQRCRNYYDLPQGLYLTQVDTGSAFYAQGLRAGDILLKLDGKSVTDPGELSALVFRVSQGQSVELQIYRLGAYHTITVTLGE